MISNTTKSDLGEKSFKFSLNLTIHHGGKPRQKVRQRPWRALLTDLRSMVCPARSPLPPWTTCSERTGPHHTNLIKDMPNAGWSIGQSDGGDPPVKVPYSQVVLHLCQVNRNPPSTPTHSVKASGERHAEEVRVAQQGTASRKPSPAPLLIYPFLLSLVQFCFVLFFS